MRSTISLRNLIRIDIRQRSWMLILTGVVCALMYPVSLLMTLQRASVLMQYVVTDQADVAMSAELLAQKKNYLTILLGPGHPPTLVAVVVAAVLAAVTGYAFLQKKNKVDFFHSLAIRREKLFFAPYLGGAFMAVVPYAVCVLLALFAVGGPFGLLDVQVVRSVMTALCINILSFLAIYSLFILGMILAGQVITGILLGVLFSAFGPFCSTLSAGLVETCYTTYFSADTILSRGYLLSPDGVMGRLVKDASVGVYKPWLILLQVAYLVVPLALAVFLYRRRPLEVAGNALVHRHMHGIVKGLVTVPVALLTGFMSYMINGSVLWMILGALIMAAFMIWMLDAIFDRDVKGFLFHKPSGIATLCVIAAIFAFLVLDPFGIDSRIPGREKVEAMSILSDRDVYEIGQLYAQGSEGVRQVLNDRLVENYEPIYALAEEGLSSVERFRGNDRLSWIYREEQSNEPGHRNESVAIAFRLSDGRVEYRRFMVDNVSLSDAMRELTKDREFREAAYPARYLRYANLMDYSIVDESDLRSNELELIGGRGADRKLLEILKEEIVEMAVDDAAKRQPIGTIYFYWQDSYDGEELTVTCEELAIYPQYTRTLAFLEKYGVSFARQKESVRLADSTDSIHVQGTDWVDSFELTDREQILQFIRGFELRRIYEATREQELHRVTFVFSDGTEATHAGVFKDIETLRALADS